MGTSIRTTMSLDAREDAVPMSLLDSAGTCRAER